MEVICAQVTLKMGLCCSNLQKKENKVLRAGYFIFFNDSRKYLEFAEMSTANVSKVLPTPTQTPQQFTQKGLKKMFIRNATVKKIHKGGDNTFKVAHFFIH